MNIGRFLELVGYGTLILLASVGIALVIWYFDRDD